MSLDMSTVTNIQFPTTFRELSYIRVGNYSEDDGCEYIDTGITAQDNKYVAAVIKPLINDKKGYIFGYANWTNAYQVSTRYGIKVDSVYVGGTDQYYVYAIADTTTTPSGYGYHSIAGEGYLWSNNHKIQVGILTNTTTLKYWGNIVDYETGVTLGDLGDGYTYYPSLTGSNILIGNQSATTNVSTNNYPCYVYRFIIRDTDENGTIEHDLRPAQRKSDGVIGLFDIITNKFHAVINAQSGGVGSIVDENPGWTDLVDVIKIEDYYNGQLRQIWPCYTPEPSNPTAPVVSNAFDYDDNITWTVGTGVENTDEYYYYPITATGQANGIQIAVADNPNGWNDDGKPTSNTTYTWYVQAERAGYYQMVMSAKMSSAGHATTGYWSGANIQVNGSTSGVQKLTLYGDTPDFDAVDYNDVVVAIVPLTGYEDAVSFQQSSWRIVVDPTSNIIFREIAATSPAFLTLDTTNVTTSYTQGDTFSYSGLVVYQTLANGTANTISSGYTVSSPDMSTTGTKTVTVTYGGLTASYDITVASAGATWVTTATLTNSDNKTVEQGTCGGYDAVRIGVLDYSSGGFGSDGRVSSTSTDEVYKITPPSAGDYMLVLPIRRGSGDPQFYINGQPIGTVYGTSSSEFLYIEITYPITLTSGENTLTIRNNSYRCYWDTDDYVYLVKSSTNPFS